MVWYVPANLAYYTWYVRPTAVPVPVPAGGYFKRAYPDPGCCDTGGRTRSIYKFQVRVCTKVVRTELTELTQAPGTGTLVLGKVYWVCTLQKTTLHTSEVPDRGMEVSQNSPKFRERYGSLHTSDNVALGEYLSP